MKISCIQMQRKYYYHHLQEKDYSLEVCKHYSRLEMEESFEMMETAAKQGADLILTLEGFNESISPRDSRYDFLEAIEPLDGPIVDRFSKLAKKYRTHIIGGLYLRRNNKAYNSGVLFGPDGNIIGIYDKVHMPMDDHKYFTAGNSYPIFETEHGKIGILICWDMQYPEAPREMALGGADLIACPTMGWETIYGACRAYENGIAIAAAMYIPCERDLWEDCCPSCILDASGKFVALGGRTGSEIVTGELDIRAEPPTQYGAEHVTGMNSMRQIRMVQRRPDTYRNIPLMHPPLFDRYEKTKL